MNKQPQPSQPVSESQLVALLAMLRVEQTPEADFETRFLAEFHERVARDAVCRSARRRLLDNLLQVFENVGGGRFAFGASALGLGVLAVCYTLIPASQTGMETRAAMAQEKQMAPLDIPALSRDLAECTTIRVMPTQSVFEIGGITVTRGENATIIEVPNTVIPAHRGKDAQKGGYRVLPSSAVRYAF